MRHIRLRSAPVSALNFTMKIQLYQTMVQHKTQKYHVIVEKTLTSKTFTFEVQTVGEIKGAEALQQRTFAFCESMKAKIVDLWQL